MFNFYYQYLGELTKVLKTSKNIEISHWSFVHILHGLCLYLKTKLNEMKMRLRHYKA